MPTRPSVSATLKRRGPAIAAGLLAAGMLASSAGVAAAAPKPTVTQVQHRLKQLNSQSSTVGQQYDQVLEQLAAASARLKVIDREASSYMAQYESMRAQVAPIAAAAYMNGNTTSSAALLTSGNAQQILDRSSILLELSAAHSDQVTRLRSAARQLIGAQQSARRVQAAILGLRNKVAGQKKSLGKLIAQQQALLAQLTPAQQAAAGPGGPAAGGGTTYTGPTTTQAEKAIAFAYAQIGKPYVWGATGPGSYDCSGLMMAAWASAGVSIPRDTYGEWAGLPHVPMSQLQPGDLVLFDGEGHVALYVGGGYLIDAPHSGAFVEKVALSGWYALQSADGVLRP